MAEWAETVGRIALPLSLVGLFIWLSLPSRGRKGVADGPEGEAYHVYTRDYDLTLFADQVVPRLPSASRDGGFGRLGGMSAWEPAAADMERLIAGWRANVDMGQWRASLTEAAQGIDLGNVVVSILIDQSGSMKGLPIASAAATAGLLADLLTSLGSKVEILGFSTAGWQGGHARMQWLDAGRPKRPGRLCALMHVIYKTADDATLTDAARRVMVHPDLLRENLDGEAILWARDRLKVRPEPHKLLMVLSDGAPVDDSTLAENGPRYLYRHLVGVLREIEADPDMIIGGVGINHDTHAWYWLAETALKPGEVPSASVRLLGQMLAQASERQLHNES